MARTNAQNPDALNNDTRSNENNEGRKQGDAKRNDLDLHGEHSAKAEELGTNSIADKLPKGKVNSSGGGM